MVRQRVYEIVENGGYLCKRGCGHVSGDYTRTDSQNSKLAQTHDVRNCKNNPNRKKQGYYYKRKKNPTTTTTKVHHHEIKKKIKKNQHPSVRQVQPPPSNNYSEIEMELDEIYGDTEMEFHHLEERIQDQKELNEARLLLEHEKSERKKAEDKLQTLESEIETIKITLNEKDLKLQEEIVQNNLSKETIAQLQAEIEDLKTTLQQKITELDIKDRGHCRTKIQIIQEQHKTTKMEKEKDNEISKLKTDFKTSIAEKTRLLKKAEEKRDLLSIEFKDYVVRHQNKLPLPEIPLDELAPVNAVAPAPRTTSTSSNNRRVRASSRPYIPNHRGHRSQHQISTRVPVNNTARRKDTATASNRGTRNNNFAHPVVPVNIVAPRIANQGTPGNTTTASRFNALRIPRIQS